MGLRTRTLVIVASVLAVFFAALLFIVRPAVVAAFNRLEIDQAEIDGEHLERAIDDETERLERIVSDWAPRNSIHQYMQGSNQEYESEYTADTLAGADINLLIALDENGAIVLSRFADLDLRVLVDADEDVLEAILDNEALQDPGDPRAHAAGAIAYRDGFMLVASRSITTSDLYGVPEGTLIAGRYLDESGIGLLADHTGLEVTAIPATGTARSSEVSRIIEALGPEDRSLVEVADADSIGIYVLVRDLQDRPLLLLRQETPRDVHVISQAVLYSQFVALLLIGIMTIVAVAILLDRSVLRRVSNLSGEMAGIALRADLSTRVSVRGRDEIASLATDINDALEAIEDSEQELVHARDQLEVRVIERTEELRSSEERYRSLVERLSDAVFIVDSGGLVTFANRRAEEIAERPMREIIGSRFSDLLSPASADEVERRTDAGISHLTGLALEVMMGDRACGPAPVELRSVPLFDEAGVPSGVQWIARDIAERKRFEEQLVHMANHDFLTGLFNRQFFESALELELADGRRTGLGGAVLWLDVDDFKEVNDTLGHRAGDEVLVSLATRLHSEIRESTVVTRLGGDEFAALLPGVGVEEAEAVAERLLTSINSHVFAASGRTVRLSASIGVVMYPTHGTTAAELLSNADVAMYLAKASGRSCVHMHSIDESLQADMRARVTWGERLAAALEEDRFRVFAQPVLDLRSGKIVRHELLIRMLVDDEIVPPAEFLPAAERLGIIRDIDRWMMGQAVKLLVDGAMGGTSIEVNLSGRAFGDADLLLAIEREVSTSGIDPKRLGFEITETAAIADMAKAQRFIATLKQIGCRFSLDDFGSGFSSFYYLKHLPIDCLKVDGCFIRGLSDSLQDQHLVRGIVELCRGLGVEIAAEYVEDERTLETVRGLGVDLAQGYHIGRPAPVDECTGTYAGGVS